MRVHSSSLISAALAILMVAIMISVTAASSEEQCYGYKPQSSVTTYLGTALDYSTAEKICCNNHKWAEYKGYLDAPEVNLFGRLNPNGETVFYDSVCGLPLFIAPRGRTFEEFKADSLYHGWPSFNPEEMISENVIIHPDGRMESKCLTHLGHNLPKGGVDRYCIDLVCIAGQPLMTDDERYNILSTVLEDDPTVIDNDVSLLDYESSAEEFSGNYTDRTKIITIVGIVIACAIVSAIMGAYLVKWKRTKEVEKDDVVNDLN